MSGVRWKGECEGEVLECESTRSAEQQSRATSVTCRTRPALLARRARDPERAQCDPLS